ncbi:MAG: cation:dicarboxylase symporter family transporter, partial [Selenomonas sp.]|nr:cation:dicarboxylase symporter family transporter [Selenomonas sp.]
ILSSDILKGLMNYERAETVYAYRNGCNEISTYARKEWKPIKIPGGAITIAALLAMVCAAIHAMLPVDWQTTILQDVADPLLKTLMGLIVAITGPFVFISIVDGICLMEDVATFSNVGLRVIRRFFSIMLLMALFAAGVCQVFFPVLALSGGSNLAPVELIRLLLGILPHNFVLPFVEGNVLQIVCIAILTGISILTLANVIPNLKTLVDELNKLIFKMMDIVSKVIYAAIFLNVIKVIAGSSMETILAVWRIIAANYVFCTGFGVLMLMHIAYKYKISIGDFLRKGAKVFLISFSTASNTAAMSANVAFAKNELEIEGKFCDFWLPLSHAMFSPSAAAALVAGVFYTAYNAQLELSLFSLVITIILALQLSIATPPVPGGIMAIYAIVFNQLQLPLDSIGMLMVSAVFVVNISSVMSMLVRDCELIDIAGEIGKRG